MSANDPKTPSASAEDPLFTRMAGEIEDRLIAIGEKEGGRAAYAFAYASISIGALFLSEASGAAHAIEYLDEIAKPLRDFLTEHGGPGVGTCQ